MAETDKPAASNANYAVIDPSDPRIQDVYANDTFVEIGNSEISIVFAQDYYDNGVKKAKPSVRVTFTHNSFMRMMDFWEQRAKFLRRVYADRAPHLYAGNTDELRRASEELYPLQSNVETLASEGNTDETTPV